MNKTILIFVASLVIASGLVGALIISPKFENNRSTKSQIVLPTPQSAVVDPTPSVASLVTTFYSISEGVKFDYPKTWSKVESGDSVLKLEKSGESNSTITVVIKDLSDSPMTLEQYNDEELNLLNKSEARKDILEEGYTTFAGIQAYKIVYTGTNSGQMNKWVQIWTVKDEKAYMLIFTSPEGSFIDHASDMDVILNSYTFTK